MEPYFNSRNMAGAIAGTAILKINGKQDHLDTITLTINNECNLHCDHCYLQYVSSKDVIGNDTLDGVMSNHFRHLSIVGKEPLVNALSISKLCEIVERCKEVNRTISIVTNGMNLSSLPSDIIPQLDYIDVSFDGGSLSYEKYRKGNLNKILDGIQKCLAHGLKEVNALHTICDQTIDNVTDCINLKRFVPFSNILFTPYLVTRNQGKNTVSPISLTDIIRQLDNNDKFNNTEGTSVLIDNYHIEQGNITVSELDGLLNKVKCTNKFRVFKDDPILYGIIRVTYDGCILSPRQSLHTTQYHAASTVNRQTDLNEAFQKLLKLERAFHGD